MNEDNKTIAANICREHAKNYGGPSTPAITVAAIVSELDKRDREISTLRSDLNRTVQDASILLGEKTKLQHLWNDAYKENAALKAELDKTRHALHETSRTTILRLEEQVGTLKSKLGEAEKALKLADKLRDSLDGQDLAAIRSQSNSFLNINAAFLDYAHIRGKQFLRTPSDGEGKA